MERSSQGSACTSPARCTGSSQNPELASGASTLGDARREVTMQPDAVRLEWEDVIAKGSTHVTVVAPAPTITMNERTRKRTHRAQSSARSSLVTSRMGTNDPAAAVDLASRIRPWASTLEVRILLGTRHRLVGARRPGEESQVLAAHPAGHQLSQSSPTAPRRQLLPPASACGASPGPPWLHSHPWTSARLVIVANISAV